MPRPQIPRKLERLLKSRARFKVAIGGRSSAKSEGVARIMLGKAQSEQADVLAGREYQTSIEDSVHKLLVGLIPILEIQGVSSTDKKIDFAHGGGVRYKGFSRNTSAVKSAQGFKYSWIEEAQDLSQQSIDDLLPTIRAGESELWFTANPQASGDPFSKRFIVPFLKDILKNGYYEDSMHCIVMMNWRDNPWHGELEEQRLWDKDHMSTAKYEHIWEGAFNDDVEDAIIDSSWFDAAIGAHLELGFKPLGAKVVSHDPSDMGADPKGLCYRHGSVIMDIQEKQGLDVNEGCDWATDYAIGVGADVFEWDGDGLGAPLRRQIGESLDGKKMQIMMFKGSEAVDHQNKIYMPDERIDKRESKTNKETFTNKRAQYYIALRDRFYNTYLAIEKKEYKNPDEMISIMPGLEYQAQFRSEVCRIPTKPNGNGRIQIMTKKEMKSILQIDSPNISDSVMMGMRMPPPIVAKKRVIKPAPKLKRF